MGNKKKTAASLEAAAGVQEGYLKVEEKLKSDNVFAIKNSFVMGNSHSCVVDRVVFK